MAYRANVEAIASPMAPFGLMMPGAALLGAIVGSFLGAALERMPRGQQVLAGRSHCDTCGTALTVTELVPVLSWLLQRGRCRTCGGAIGWWQLGCELGGAAIAVGALVLAPAGVVLAAMALGWQLLLLAALDLRHLWLPRGLTGLLAATGLVLATARAWALQDVAALLPSLAGGALGFALLWLIAQVYRRLRGREGLGGGDAPLLGAIGLWLGAQGVIHVVLGASLLGLAMAAIMVLSGRKVAAQTAVPLGTCLAAAAWPLFLMHGFA